MKRLIENIVFKSARYIFSFFEKSKSKLFLNLTEHIHARFKRSYSLFGEDLVIDGILNRIKYETGSELRLSYVDIGAWRPIAGSNTWFLYKRGSNGTAVDPNPNMIYRWKKLRNQDEFVNCGVGLAGEQDFFLFDENSPANSFNIKFIEGISTKESVNIGSKIKIRCVSLEEILRNHLRTHKADYLLDIDVEGLDYEVLQTFDFKSLQRPILISVEDTEQPLKSSRINVYLDSKNYFLIGRTVLSSIYGDRERDELINLTPII